MNHDFDNHILGYSHILDLVKLKGFYPYEHMNDFKNFKHCKEKKNFIDRW